MNEEMAPLFRGAAYEGALGTRDKGGRGTREDEGRGRTRDEGRGRATLGYRLAAFQPEPFRSFLIITSSSRLIDVRQATRSS